MLPAIVLILFFNGAVNAVNMVLSQTNEKKRSIAVLLALGLGVLPALQFAEVWNQAVSPTLESSSTPSSSNEANRPLGYKLIPGTGMSNVGKKNSQLP